MTARGVQRGQTVSCRGGVQCHGMLKCAVNVILFYQRGKRSGEEQDPREMGDEAEQGARLIQYSLSKCGLNFCNMLGRLLEARCACSCSHGATSMERGKASHRHTHF